MCKAIQPLAARILAVLLSAVMLASCASSNTVVGTWKDKDYHKQLSKVLVIGLTKRANLRRAFEDTLVRKLRAKGVDATASTGIVHLGDNLDRASVKADIKAAIEKDRFDNVLVTHLIKVDQQTTYIPPGDHPKYSFYGTIMTVYSSVYTPGYLVNSTVVSLETDLYDTVSEKLVWSMTSQSFNPKTAQDIIDTLSDYIVKDLAQNHFM